ncbi:hypothetical protein [Spiroplasma tabanidicola]|uniref:Uncharacterized protein n=1 Tax=Spiroplasma tabanidicola TaxID=324079 RepID=A0A6I6C7W8_9MOLU|nr:hypothetical protein [Spiroplasma tabanidicola]QGS52320.1 hypothetical protein STABA_v1c09670 [Spiroplasma tabanidicola]
MITEVQYQRDVGQLKNNDDIGNKVTIETNKDGFLSMDVVFVNQQFYIGKEKYYRLLIRPTIKDDAWSKISRDSYNKEINISIEKTEINMAIDSDFGAEGIKLDWGKNNQTEKNIIKKMLFKIKNTKLSQMSNVEFREILVPIKDIRNNKIMRISFTLNSSYTISGFDNNTSGHIIIDLRPFTTVVDTSILLHDYVYLNLQNDYDKTNFKRKVLVKKLFTIEIFEDTNRIDFDLNIKNINYFFYDEIKNSQVLGLNLKTFMDRLKIGQNNNKVVEATWDINSKDIKKFYDLKKPNPIFQLESENDYAFKTNVKTEYNIQKNIVRESEYGRNGIVKNPNIDDKVTFSWNINFGGLILNLFKNINTIDLSNLLVQIESVNFEIKKAYELNITNSDLLNFAFDDNDIETVIDYIIKNEKDII